jgi:TetR/AcrR family transcriptional regulator, regulator of autoinduction and epiphytic fitness
MLETTDTPTATRETHRIETRLVVDGRTARRNRNKQAVLAAMISLTREQGEEPSVESIAERAGVSYRSVYRYFDDRADLLLAAISHVMAETRPVLDLDEPGSGSLEQRARDLIDSRLTAYRELAPLTRLAIRRSTLEPDIAVELDNVRMFLREQIAEQFAAELDRLSERERGVAVTALDVMFQFESLEHLGRLGAIDDGTAKDVLVRHVAVHLAPDGVARSAN